MTRQLRLAVLLLVAAPACGADLDEAAERSRIDRERSAADSRYATEAADCNRRFFVTDCLDDAKARRRDALQRLRREELVLDDEERKRRAAARLEAIETRQREMAARPPAPAQPAPVVREAAQRPPPAELTDPGRDGAGRRGTDAAKAARRAEAAERSRRQAEADRSRIAEREAERAARGKRTDPLPPRPPIPPR